MKLEVMVLVVWCEMKVHTFQAPRFTLVLASLLLASLLLFACGEPGGTDAGGVDAGPNDADTPLADAGDVDAGEATCGDGVAQGLELCDGPDVSCASLSAGYTSGTARCRDRCEGYDVSACGEAPLRVWELVKPAERSARWENARCNDGTPYDFLYRPGAPDSHVWVIYLQGGGFGDDDAFPTGARGPELTSTVALADGVRGPLPMLEHGLFGAAAINPDFHEAHMVFAHYCSSDFYSGRGTERRPVSDVADGYYFAGRHNMRATLEILVQRYGLDDDEASLQVLYGGASAGCIGATQTANIPAGILPNAASSSRLRIFADGAYIVGAQTDEPELFWGAADAPDVELFNRAIEYWDAEPLPACTSTERGECYLGRGWYPGLTDGMGLPVLVAMSVMDEVVLGLRGACTEGCGPGGPVCFPGCTTLTPERYAEIRASYRAEWSELGVGWLFAWGSPEHTAGLVDNRWNGPSGASEPLRTLVGEFFFDRGTARTVFVNGADL